MGNCRECSYWVHDSSDDCYYNVPVGWRRCVLMQTDNWRAQREATKAYAVDLEMYQADLLSAPTFGCVMFVEMLARKEMKCHEDMP